MEGEEFSNAEIINNVLIKSEVDLNVEEGENYEPMLEYSIASCMEDMDPLETKSIKEVLEEEVEQKISVELEMDYYYSENAGETDPLKFDSTVKTEVKSEEDSLMMDVARFSEELSSCSVHGIEVTTATDSPLDLSSVLQPSQVENKESSRELRVRANHSHSLQASKTKFKESVLSYKQAKQQANRPETANKLISRTSKKTCCSPEKVGESLRVSKRTRNKPSLSNSACRTSQSKIYNKSDNEKMLASVRANQISIGTRKSLRCQKPSKINTRSFFQDEVELRVIGNDIRNNNTSKRNKYPLCPTWQLEACTSSEQIGELPSSSKSTRKKPILSNKVQIESVKLLRSKTNNDISRVPKMTRRKPFLGAISECNSARVSSKTTRRRNFCMYCKTFQSRLSRHVLKKHLNEPVVMECRKIKGNDKQAKLERMKILNDIRCRSKRIYNEMLLEKNKTNGIADLLLERRPKKDVLCTLSSFIMCKNCGGILKRNSFRRHARNCVFNGKADLKKYICFLKEYGKELGPADISVAKKSKKIATAVPKKTNRKVSCSDSSKTTRKRNFCMYCKTFQSNLPRHVLRKHPSEPVVMEYHKIKGNDKQAKIERMKILHDIRCRSKRFYNEMLLEKNETNSIADLLLERRLKKDELCTHSSFIMCKNCGGIFKRKSFHSHARNCVTKEITLSEQYLREHGKEPKQVEGKIASSEGCVDLHASLVQLESGSLFQPSQMDRNESNGEGCDKTMDKINLNPINTEMEGSLLEITSGTCKLDQNKALQWFKVLSSGNTTLISSERPTVLSNAVDNKNTSEIEHTFSISKHSKGQTNSSKVGQPRNNDENSRRSADNDESKGTQNPDIENQSVKKIRISWSNEAKSIVYKAFEDCLKNKCRPGLKRCRELINKEKIIANRSPTQVNALVDNWIRGKSKLPEDVSDDIKSSFVPHPSPKEDKQIPLEKGTPRPSQMDRNESNGEGCDKTMDKINSVVKCSQLSFEEFQPEIRSEHTGGLPQKLNKRKKIFCFYCKTLKTDIYRHFFQKHPNDPSVLAAKKIKGCDIKTKQLKAKIFDKVRNKGNQMYNEMVLAKKGTVDDLILKKRSIKDTQLTFSSCIVCKHCGGIYKKKKFSFHARRCVLSCNTRVNSIVQAMAMKHTLYLKLYGFKVKKRNFIGKNSTKLFCSNAPSQDKLHQINYNAVKSVNFCFYCQTKQEKLQRHLLSKHPNDSLVIQYSEVVGNEPEARNKRSNILSKIRLKGILSYNKMVLTKKLLRNYQSGIKYQSKEVINSSWVVCKKCTVLYQRKYFYIHARKCAQSAIEEVGSFNNPLKKRKKCINYLKQYGRELYPIKSALSQKTSQLVTTSMKVDDISRVSFLDPLLATILDEYILKNSKLNSFIKANIRYATKILITMQKRDTNINNFEDCLSKEYVDVLISAIEELCGCDHAEKSVTVKSLYPRIIWIIKVSCRILMDKAFKNKNGGARNRITDFLTAFLFKWKSFTSETSKYKKQVTGSIPSEKHSSNGMKQSDNQSIDVDHKKSSGIESSISYDIESPESDQLIFCNSTNVLSDSCHSNAFNQCPFALSSDHKKSSGIESSISDDIESPKSDQLIFSNSTKVLSDSCHSSAFNQCQIAPSSNLQYESNLTTEFHYANNTEMEGSLLEITSGTCKFDQNKALQWFKVLSSGNTTLISSERPTVLSNAVDNKHTSKVGQPRNYDENSRRLADNDESKGTQNPDIENQSVKKIRISWSNEAKSIVYKAFEDCLKNKCRPGLKRCRELINKEKIIANRSPTQVNILVDNWIRGKSKLPEDVSDDIKSSFVPHPSPKENKQIPLEKGTPRRIKKHKSSPSKTQQLQNTEENLETQTTINSSICEMNVANKTTEMTDHLNIGNKSRVVDVNDSPAALSIMANDVSKLSEDVSIDDNVKDNKELTGINTNTQSIEVTQSLDKQTTSTRTYANVSDPSDAECSESELSLGIESSSGSSAEEGCVTSHSKKKFNRMYWSQDAKLVVYQNFKDLILKKSRPGLSKCKELIAKEIMLTGRTPVQVNLLVDNWIRGKTKLPKIPDSNESDTLASKAHLKSTKSNVQLDVELGNLQSGTENLTPMEEKHVATNIKNPTLLVEDESFVALKWLKRRKQTPWTDEAKRVVYKKFRNYIINKSRPGHKLCSELISKIPVLSNRTPNQVNILVDNWIRGKCKIPTGVESNDGAEVSEDEVNISSLGSPVTRKRWSEEEKSLVINTFQDYISRNLRPGLAKCEQLINKHSILIERTPAQINALIDNWIRGKSNMPDKYKHLLQSSG